MPGLSRRSVLRGGLAAAAAVGTTLLTGRVGAAGAVPPRRRPGSFPFPHLPAGTDTLPQIEHVVVLMMENHSYDNYLGMLRRGDGFRLGKGGRPVDWNPNRRGERQLAFPMPNDCQLRNKPSQTWSASHQQYDHGTNRGFVTSPSGPVAMGYWDRRGLPFYYSLASTFPLADRWFCSLLGQTFPNRRYLTAATSAGMVDDVVAQLSTRPPNGTIFDRLDHYGITWRDYYHPASVPTVDVWPTEPAARSPNVVPVDTFFSDAAAGTLPSFSIVDPTFAHGSEEDPQDISVGESFAARVIGAVLHGAGWARSLLLWTYDEHGGYYDHVPPPPAPAPDSIQPLLPVGPGGQPAYDGFHRFGFRVPAVVVSPYARRNHVTSVVHDHTSVLAMVERKWNLPALTYRDANAADLLDFLDMSAPSFANPPTLPPAATPAGRCTPGRAGIVPPRPRIAEPSG
jgi:phospholipase C